MIFLTIFCVLVLFRVDIVSGEAQCSDCVLLRFCHEAIHYIKEYGNLPEGKQKLTKAHCGSQSIDGQNAPKVCCSVFTNETNTINSRLLNDGNIESHPNLSLLPESCGGIDGKRIVGGIFANMYEFPWMALISHRTREESGNIKLSFQCGGSIITSRYILTAAHCVTHLSNAEIAGVRVGEFDIRHEQDCQGEHEFKVCENYIQDLLVEKVIPHKDYKKVYYINDIALLRLKKNIDLTRKNAKPICLPIAKELRDRQITSGNQMGTVAGWGLTDTGVQSQVLRKVDVPILTADNCDLNLSNPDLKVICAYDKKKDSCRGDSGGPLMLEDEVNGKYRSVQYGIVSSGTQSCGSSGPALYTDVTKYIQWILDTIEA